MCIYIYIYILSGQFPVDVRIPPLKIKILPESNPLNPRVFSTEIGRTTVAEDCVD